MGNGSSIYDASLDENERKSGFAEPKLKQLPAVRDDGSHKKSAPKQRVVIFDEKQDVHAKGTPKAAEQPAVAEVGATAGTQLLLGLTKKQYTQSLPLLGPVIEALKAEENMSSLAVLKGHAFLYEWCAPHSYNKRDDWVAKALQAGYVQMVKAQWPKFESPDFLGIGDPNWKMSSNVYQSFQQMWQFMWNASDCSTPFCAALEENAILEIALQLLRRPDMKPQVIQKEMKEKYFFVAMAATGVLHNAIRRHRLPTKRRLRAVGLIDVMKRYLTSDHVLIRMVASMILAYAVDESEMEMLKTQDDIIAVMVHTLLKQAIKDPKRRSLGFAVDEIIEALNALGNHDSNKKKMLEQDVIPLYFQVIKAPFSDSELMFACKGIWNMTFIPESVTYIKEKHPDYAAMLKPHTTNVNERIGKAATGALWNIEPPQEPKRPATGSPKNSPRDKQQHIMISYDHQHKHIVHKLAKQLKAQGYHIWLDAEQMHGSTLDAMFEAINNSGVILLCFSERYYESNNCRAEAEQAFKLNKEIVPVRTEKYSSTGWLSMILGTRLYVNIFTPEEVDNRVAEVAKQLGDKCKRSDMPGAVNGSPQLGAKPAGKPLKEWNNQEVQKFLVANDLGHIGGKLGTFDGPAMSGLRDLHRQSPNLFFEQARNFLGISDLALLLKLTQKLATVP